MSFIIFLLAFIFGYIVGSIVTAVVCHPNKSFDEGYEATKRFTDQYEWFNNGWKAAKEYYKKRRFGNAFEMHSHQELMEEAEKRGVTK